MMMGIEMLIVINILEDRCDVAIERSFRKQEIFKLLSVHFGARTNIL